METENIAQTIYRKIQNLTGEDFPLEKDFDEQILEIRKHYLAALNGQIHPGNEQSWMRNMDEYYPFGISNTESREIVRNKLNQTFIRKDSWSHKYFTEDDSNLLYYWLQSSERWKETILQKKPFLKLRYQWAIIDKAVRYLRAEKSNKIRKYFINILDERQDLLSENGNGFHSGFTLLIYLITSDRIITAKINNEIIILSTEHIINRDLKKVEIANETKIRFHYHGLHDPEVLHLDSYEEAVDLRKEITELREQKIKSR